MFSREPTTARCRFRLGLFPIGLIFGLMVTGCGSPGLEASAPPEEVARTFSSCDLEGHSYFDAPLLLASTTDWYQVETIVKEGASRPSTQPLNLSLVRVRAIDAAGEADGEIEELEMPLPSDTIKAIRWAVWADKPVFLAIDEDGAEDFYPRQLVAVATEVDSDVVFLGRCAEDDIGAPLRLMHGANYFVKMQEARSLIGQELEMALRPGRAPSQEVEPGPGD